MKLSSKKNLQKGEAILFQPAPHEIRLIKPMVFMLGLFFLSVLGKMSIENNYGIFASIGLIGTFILLGLLSVAGNSGKLIPLLVLGSFGTMGSFTILSAAKMMVGPVAQSLVNDSLIGGIAISVLWLVVETIRYSLEEYYVTNKRILIKQIFREGCFSSIKEIPIEKIESVHCDQGIVGSLLNFGTVSFYGVGGIPFRLIEVAKPFLVRRRIYEVMEKNRRITVIKELKPLSGTQTKQVQVEQIGYGTFVSIYPAE